MARRSADMARTQSRFRQGDVTRALRAARAAGLDVTGYEVDIATGRILVTTGHLSAEANKANALDLWMATHNAD